MKAKKKITKIRTNSKKSIKSKRAIIRKARPLHKKVMLHPITVFILLCVGVIITSLTFRANADEYVITAKVAAPPLITGATISQPSDGTTFSEPTTTVKGTCPTDSYIILYRNAATSGVALCEVDNTYQINTSLYTNTNTLKVQAFNITDDPGPTTPEINVIYTPPAEIATSTGSPSSNVSSVSSKTSNSYEPPNLPLLTSSFHYQTFTTKDTFGWDVDVAGGVAPYQLSIQWGDGMTSTQKVNKAQSVRLNHRYSKVGHFTIFAKIVDSKGLVSILQVIAIIKNPGSLVTTNNIASSVNGQNSILSSGILMIAKHWAILAWGSYATVSLMTLSFWLGERQKYSTMIAASRVRKTRHHAR